MTDHKFNHPIANVEYSPQTIHGHVRILRTFSNWLRDEGYSRNPILERLELPRLPKVKIAVLSQEEIHQVLNSINPATSLGARLMAMILVMLDPGIRAGELLGCKCRMWNGIMGDQSVRQGIQGGSLPSAQPRSKRCCATYRPFAQSQPAMISTTFFLSVDGYPLTVNALVHIMTRLANNSGVERLHAHLLRHTSGVQYLVNGGNTNHSRCTWVTAQMTNHYSN